MTILTTRRTLIKKTHHLKTWCEYYEALVHPDLTLRKTLEIRKNDRDFNVGDILILEEYDKISGYTGRKTSKRITHILSGSPWLPEGYVAMSIIDYDYYNS